MVSTERSQQSTEADRERYYDHASGELSPTERFWGEQAEWLKSKGYVLPPRYQPGWVPSWRETKKPPFLCPDGKRHQNPKVMDATRTSDGTLVMLKVIREDQFPDEIDIAQSLSSDKSNKRNHCVPILDVLSIPDVERRRIIVMPYLFLSDLPWFDTIGEVVDFCGQMFEGLAYIHSHNIYHGDAKFDNVLMDAKRLFLTSFHPVAPRLVADCSKKSKTSYRTEHPTKYYFIDYDLAKVAKPGTDYKIRGTWGGDKTVPEFEIDEPHDPFAVDVYCIGNIVRQHFVYGDPDFDLKPKLGFAFLKTLVDDMCQNDPTKRPKMDEVVERFTKIQNNLSSWTLRSRVVDVGENPIVALIRSAEHWTRRASYMVRRKPAIPSP